MSLSEILLNDAKKICESVDLQGLSGKTILITGASGMIGSYILACLKNVVGEFGDKTKVVVVMRHEPEGYLKELMDYDGVEIFQGDLAEYSFCKTLPVADYIVHSAGYAQPQFFLADQEKTLKINTLATFALLDKLSPNGKFLFISSSEVYSGLSGGKYREDQIGNTNTTHPRSCYIEGKRCGEAICNAYRAKGVDAKSVRLSSTYGPGTKINDKRVLPSFIGKGLAGEIKLLDNGDAVRTYCYVTDAVQLIWKILFHGKDSIYNVGGNSRITISDLALKIGNYLDAPVVFPKDSANSLVGSVTEMSVDMSKAEEEFGVVSYIGFDDGLKKTIEWVKLLHGRS